MNGVHVGDKLPVIPDSTWKRMSRVRPMEGPRCYLCNRLFRKGDTQVVVATDERRMLFAMASPGYREGFYVGAECARKYVPPESVVEVVRYLSSERR